MTNEVLEEILAGDIGPKLARHAELKAEAGKIEKEMKDLKAEIIAYMDSQGLDSVRAGGRLAGFSTRVRWGMAKTETAVEKAGQLQALREFIRAHAPEADVPASTNINRAINAYMDQGGSEETLPPIFEKTEIRSLSNRKG